MPVVETLEDEEEGLRVESKSDKVHERQIKKLDFMIQQLLLVVDLGKLGVMQDARGRMQEMIARSQSPGNYYSRYVASVVGRGLGGGHKKSKSRDLPMDKKTKHKKFPSSLANPAFLNLKVPTSNTLGDRTIITETNEGESVQ
mmetsp:Transcript_5319/g.4033  ORF Transcript_5319/g.4033 Transcript_5319/m.4033 type:complete len:143 (+) Transcript_5319:410-838(+)